MPAGTIALAASIVAIGAAHAQTPTPQYPAMAPLEQYLSSSADSEIALARTAAPPSISAAAEVLVLGRHGYETAVRGTNGFVCFVERSWASGFGTPEFWNPRLRAPNCYNPPAVRTELPRYLARTEWVLSGADQQAMIDRTRSALASNRFQHPEAGALAYMLSKRGYLGDQAGGPWLPHVMFFVRQDQAASFGADAEGSPILSLGGSEIESTLLLVPVRAWSDGTPAPPLVARNSDSKP